MTSLQALRELAENAQTDLQGEPWYYPPRTLQGEYIAAANPRILTALLDVVEAAYAKMKAHPDSDDDVAADMALLDALDNLNNLLETENGGEG